MLAGTLVKDIYPGVVGSQPDALIDVAGTMYFRATDGFGGCYLWKSDGTAQNTSLGYESVCPIEVASVGSTLGLTLPRGPGPLFLGADWIAFASMTLRDPANLTASGGYFFCTVSESPGSVGWVVFPTHPQMYRISVTGNTELVGVFEDAATESDRGPTIHQLTDVDGRVFFTLFNDDQGWQLWKTDGTLQSTHLLGDVDLIGKDDAADLTNVNGTLFFVGQNHLGRELWKSDGTVAGTGMLKDIRVGLNSSSPAELTNVSGALFFTGDNGIDGVELWKSDGTDAGTTIVSDINPNGDSSPSGLVDIGGVLYFAADDGAHGSELWRSDGTAGGTFMVADIFNGSQSSSPFNITNVDGTIFFMARDGQRGIELWKTDGTAEGTMIVHDVRPGPQSAFDSRSLMKQASGTLFFTADDGIHGQELWSLQALRPNAGGSYSVPENGLVSLSAAASTCDPGSTITAYDWDFHYDGTSFDTDFTSAFPTATFDGFGIDGPAVRTVAVRIHDDLGRSSIATAPVTITNAAPTASIGGPAVGVRGQTLSFALAAADPSTADMAAGFTYKVDFGDGAGPTTIPRTADNGTGDVTVSRLYTKAGTYTIRVTATDTSGAASPVATFPVTITVAAVRPDPADPDVSHLFVGGTTAADTIRISPGPTANKIRVVIGTSVVGTYAKPSGRVIVFGQAGDDTITVFPTLAVPVELHGDDGADRLSGGAARDILLGGKGPDQLNGGAADDILVAGFTSYDADIAAWSGIFDEWSGRGTYATKLANLLAGTGLNDPYLLKGGAGATVFNDSAVDILVGAAGTDAYFTSAGDAVSDLAKGETNTAIVGPAMAMAKFFAAAGSQPSPSVPTKTSAITSLRAKIFSALGQ